MPILSEKERLLRKIQACSFALVEANLYLDSHLQRWSGIFCPPQGRKREAYCSIQ